MTHASFEVPLHGELEQYARGVSDVPLVDEPALTRLLERTRTGDPEATESLVAVYLRWVVDEALRMRGTGIPLPRLIQAGNRGLRQAALRYRGGGVDVFTDSALSWIRRELRGHLEAS